MAVSQKLTLTQLENSQNNNYRVRVLWTSTQTGSSYNETQRTAYLYYSVNGGDESIITIKYTLPLRSEKVIIDTTIEIPPATGGIASISVRTWMNTHISAGVVELSDELELKPVESTISATDAMIGSTSVVTVYRNGADHVHSVKYVFGQQSGYLTEAGSISGEETVFTANEILFSIPDSFYGEIPSDVQGICHLFCVTYSGGVQVGEVQETSFVVSVDESMCRPEVSGTVCDINEATIALTGNDKTLIRYHSDALCTIFTEAKHNASINKMWIDGVVTETSLLKPAIQQGLIPFLVEDSRGITNAFVYTSEVIPYTHLSVTPHVERDDPTSGNATLRYSGYFYCGSFGTVDNILNFEYKIGSGEYIPAEIEYSVENGKYSAELKLSGLDYRKVFTITIRVSDRLEIVEKPLTLKKGIPVFDWGEGDFAFHVPVQMDENLNVGGSFTIGGKAVIDIFYPVNSIYMTTAEGNPSDLFGGSWELLQNDEESIYRWIRTG